MRSPCRCLSSFSCSCPYFMFFSQISTKWSLFHTPVPPVQTSLRSVMGRVHYRTYRTFLRPVYTQMCPKWPHLRFARVGSHLPPSAQCRYLSHLSIFVRKVTKLHEFREGVGPACRDTPCGRSASACFNGPPRGEWFIGPIQANTDITGPTSDGLRRRGWSWPTVRGVSDGCHDGRICRYLSHRGLHN